MLRQKRAEHRVQPGKTLVDGGEVLHERAGLGQWGELMNQRLHRCVRRAPIRSQFHYIGTECLHVIASPVLACVVADPLERSLRLLLRGKLSEYPAPRRSDRVLREIVSVLQRLFQTPESRLQKSENGFLKRVGLREGILSIVGRERLFPCGGFLLCLRERMGCCIQFGGQFLEGNWRRTLRQNREQISFGQRAGANGKFQNRPNLVERVP